jgi:hypothetical protein
MVVVRTADDVRARIAAHCEDARRQLELARGWAETGNPAPAGDACIAALSELIRASLWIEDLESTGDG